jgi:hypothetical protein
MVLDKVYLEWVSPDSNSGTSLGFLWSEQVMSISIFLVLGTMFQIFEIKEKSFSWGAFSQGK